MQVQKLHNALLKAVFENLESIFVKGFYADKVIEYCFRNNKQFGSRDRRFIAETTYDIVRHWRLLNHIAETDDASENRYAKVLTAYFIFTNHPFKEQYNYLLDEKKVNYNLRTIEDPAIKNSFPEWLNALCNEELGDKWMENIEALNQEAKAVIRINTLKAKAFDVKKFLDEEHVPSEYHDKCKDALILGNKKNIFNTNAFKNGWFEMQDISSQLVGELLGVEPGMRVLDACAGAGGKTLHLAALMQNKGKLIAMDVEEKKLIELKKRCARAGVQCVETKVIKNERVFDRFEGTFDRILIDAPCSGLGVIKRNPDSKWKLSVEQIDRVKEIQKSILANYPKALKIGGKMIYATCSVLPSENDKQVALFLKENPNFSLIESKTLWPAETGFDGFFMALIQRNA